MSDGGPFGAGGSFGDIPFFGDLFRMMQSQGPISWDTARSLAASIATDGTSEPNVDPAERIQLEQLGRVADLHVSSRTGLSTAPGGRSVEIAPVNRSTWAARTLDAYRPLLEKLAGSLASTPDLPPDLAATDPTAAMLGPLMQMMGPVMLSMTAGSMVGHLAGRSLGMYDLPVPRPLTGELLVVVPNIDRFGEEWSLPLDELRLWVCVHELAHHSVLGVPHVGSELTSLLEQYAAGFRPDPTALTDRLGTLDFAAGPESLAQFQELLGDPEVVLGAVQSPAQRAMLPRLEALVATVVGYVDHVMDAIGASLMSSYGMLTEALRRRRVEADRSDRFVERILGLNLTQHQYERGAAFVSGVVERAGEAELARLWESPRTLPTPAEVDAPGLWLARIDLPV
ncbi:MAG TPA: zinc-dependent metalloprotease [Acidimicrobiales bacterium]|nr:zinc-dependent metalloprotease [Acidimicrobiales bacterium]